MWRQAEGFNQLDEVCCVQNKQNWPQHRSLWNAADQFYDQYDLYNYVTFSIITKATFLAYESTFTQQHVHCKIDYYYTSLNRWCKAFGYSSLTKKWQFWVLGAFSLFFFRTDSTDSLDCLPILLSISVFFPVFSFFSFSLFSCWFRAVD